MLNYRLSIADDYGTELPEDEIVTNHDGKYPAISADLLMEPEIDEIYSAITEINVPNIWIKIGYVISDDTGERIVIDDTVLCKGANVVERFFSILGLIQNESDFYLSENSLLSNILKNSRELGKIKTGEADHVYYTNGKINGMGLKRLKGLRQKIKKEFLYIREIINELDTINGNNYFHDTIDDHKQRKILEKFRLITTKLDDYKLNKIESNPKEMDEYTENFFNTYMKPCNTQ